MDAYECIRSRREVRDYRPDPVSDDVVRRILQAGRWAPSSRNEQPWHFIVVRDRETLRAIGDIATSGGFIADAPMAIAVAMENAFRRDLDAGRALQQMQLAAWSEGVGSCFVGFTLEEPIRRIKDLLGIPDNVELVTVVPFGYLTREYSGTGGKRRKPLAEIAHSERFGVKYEAA